MDDLQTIPAAEDEPAWSALAQWLGDAVWERHGHGVSVETALGRKTAFVGDHLYRDREGRVTVLFAGSLERAHAPPPEPEAWELTIEVFHAHGDSSRAISVILGQADGRIDAKALAAEIEGFVSASARPADISVSVELKSRVPRGKRAAMPSLEELQANAGTAFTTSF